MRSAGPIRYSGTSICFLSERSESKDPRLFLLLSLQTQIHYEPRVPHPKRVFVFALRVGYHKSTYAETRSSRPHPVYDLSGEAQ